LAMRMSLRYSKNYHAFRSIKSAHTLKGPAAWLSR
jgi:hypothetical protein